jgi:hypothetical protein
MGRPKPPEEVIRRLVRYAESQGMKLDGIRLTFEPVRPGAPRVGISFDASAPEQFSLHTEGNSNKLTSEVYIAITEEIAEAAPR